MMNAKKSMIMKRKKKETGEKEKDCDVEKHDDGGQEKR
jgi:hypothetical protein